MAEPSEQIPAFVLPLDEVELLHYYRHLEPSEKAFVREKVSSQAKGRSRRSRRIERDRERFQQQIADKEGRSPGA